MLLTIPLSLYRYLMNRVAPALGKIKLQHLTGAMFQSLYAKWRKEGMSANAIRLIHTIIKKALDDAVTRRKLALNPVRDAEPPRKEEREMHVLDVARHKSLWKLRKGLDSTAFCIWHCWVCAEENSLVYAGKISILRRENCELLIHFGAVTP